MTPLELVSSLINIVISMLEFRDTIKSRLRMYVYSPKAWPQLPLPPWLPRYTNKHIGISPCRPSTLSEYTVSLHVARPQPVNMHMFDCRVRDGGRNWAEMPTSWWRRAQRGFCQSYSGTKKFSDAHRHTSEMDNKARGVSEGALTGSG